MGLKRNRTGNDELVLRASQNQPKLVKATDSDVGLRHNPPAPVAVRVGEFLRRCYYCRKDIPAIAEVFMYRDFCAFCSAECRDIQIELDKASEDEDNKMVS